MLAYPKVHFFNNLLKNINIDFKVVDIRRLGSIIQNNSLEIILKALVDRHLVYIISSTLCDMFLVSEKNGEHC